VRRLTRPRREITYTFTVTNTCAQSLNDVVVTDPKIGAPITCAETLAPGASATCTGPAYTLTQTDVDAGGVTNSATAAAMPKTGSATPIAHDAANSKPSTITPITALAEITLEKRAGAVIDGDGNGHDAGDTVGYNFTVTNTSNVTLRNITITDPMAASVTCASTTLAPRTSTTCSSSPHTITQAEVDARRVENTATVSATPPSGAAATALALAVVDLSPVAKMTLTKVDTCDTAAAGDTGTCDLGDALSYDFTVTNTGAASIDAVTIDDPALKLVDFTCGAEPLAAGATRTCSAPSTHLVTQSDLDAGRVTNTATAAAKSGPSSLTAGDSDEIVFDTPSSVSITKSVTSSIDIDDSRSWTAGDTITWRFDVRNTGRRTLSAVRVSDPLLGVTGLLCATNLAPGAGASCSSPVYTITAADVAAKAVTNTATATATLPGGSTATVTGSGSSTVPLEEFRTLRLVKSATITKDVLGDKVAGLGDELTYTFEVTNSGAQPVTEPSVADDLLTVRGIAVTCPSGEIAPGASVTCAASGAYVLTAADLASPTLQNAASAQASTLEGNRTPIAQASHVEPLGYGTLAMTKTVEITTDGMGIGIADEDDVVTSASACATPARCPSPARRSTTLPAWPPVSPSPATAPPSRPVG